jgi:hypothetical protein
MVASRAWLIDWTIAPADQLRLTGDLTAATGPFRPWGIAHTCGWAAWSASPEPIGHCVNV